MKSSSLRSRYSIVRFALGVAVFALVHSLASAANFPVTVLTDAAPSAGGLGDGPGVAGDLRAAILAANTAGGTNTITFTVAAPPATITLGGPLPPITSNLTIDGGTFGRVIIDGNNSYRAFFVDTGTVTIKNLQVQNVRAAGGTGGVGVTAGGGGAGFGAGLFVNQATAVVSVQNVQIDHASVIGGVGGAGSAAAGNGSGGGGGGMGSAGAAGAGVIAGGAGGGGMTRPGSTFTGNTGGAGGAGGGGGGGDAIGGNTNGGGGSGYAGNPAGDPGSDRGGNGGFGGGGGGGGSGGYSGGTGGFGGGGGGSGFSASAGGPGGFGGGGGREEAIWRSVPVQPQRWVGFKAGPEEPVPALILRVAAGAARRQGRRFS